MDRLTTAEREDVGNVQTREVLARYTIQRWKSIPPQDQQRRNMVAGNAVNLTALARRANPEGEEGYLVEYYVYVTIGAELNRLAEQITADLKKDEKEKKDKKLPPAAKAMAAGWRQEMLRAAPEAYRNAALALEPYVPRDPTNPHLRYQIASARASANDPDGAREAAKEALELDRQIGTDRPRSLTERQRAQLKSWLSGKSAP
jgi:hypothetical protein